MENETEPHDKRFFGDLIRNWDDAFQLISALIALGLIFGTVMIGINVGIAEAVAFAVFFIGGLFALLLVVMALLMLWTDFAGTISLIAITAFCTVIFLAACKIVFGW
jgi:hypothetical protein